MSFTQACPNCSYQRKATDAAPDWQCPSCGIAYAKVLGVNQTLGAQRATMTSLRAQTSRRDWFDRTLSLFLVMSILALLVAWWIKDDLPDFRKITTELQNDPIQKTSRVQPFDFDYRKRTYSIEPVAEYELWGLVVTHNDIMGMTDIIHDDDSVDIKDICVVWGDNVINNDYRKVSYSSGDFTCYYEYELPMDFSHDQLSNNHLLSDDEEIRERIRNIKIGDQVHLKGMLVNYSAAATPDWKRNTSTNRNDTGNGACEVVFVEEFNILKSTNRLAYFWFDLSFWLIIFFVLFKLAAIAFFPNFLKE